MIMDETSPKKLIRIRYNTDATQGDPFIWRVIKENYEEMLAKEVKINVPSFTSLDKLPDGRIKAHVSVYYDQLKEEDGIITVL